MRVRLPFLSATLSILLLLVTILLLINNLKKTSINSEYLVGDYISINIEPSLFFFRDKKAVIDGMLYFDGSQLSGRLTKVGTFSYEINGITVDIKVKSKLDREICYSNVCLISKWDDISANSIYVSVDGAKEKLISYAPDSIKWQFTISKSGRYAAWVEIAKHEGYDKVVLVDLKTGSQQYISSKYTIHRSPIISNGYLYWYQDSLESDGNRKVAINKADLNDVTRVIPLLITERPNIVSDYEVLPNGDLVAIVKNHKQQRSEIIEVGRDGQRVIYAENRSFIQNLFLDDDSFNIAFEIKAHGKVWRVEYYDTRERKMYKRVWDPNVDTVLVSFDQTVPLDYGISSLQEKISILIERYTPPMVGFSYYSNDLALLSIVEAPLIRSIINIADVTENYGYYYVAAQRLSNIVEKAYNIDNVKESKEANWSVRAFSLNNSSNISYLVHDASILDALLLFAEKVEHIEELNVQFSELKNKILFLFEQKYMFHERNKTTFENDQLGLIQEGEVYFSFPKNIEFIYDGVNLPFNMMNSYVRPLLIAYKLTGNRSYKDDAVSIGNLFKRHIYLDADNDIYLWPYWWGLYRNGWNEGEVSTNTPSHQGVEDIADTDHASIDVRAIIALAQYGLVFDHNDLDMIQKTMAFNLDDNDYRSSLLINNTIKSANYNSIDYLWATASENGCGSYDIISRNLSSFPYVQDAYTATARFEIVGLSHLYKKAIQCNNRL